MKCIWLASPSLPFPQIYSFSVCGCTSHRSALSVKAGANVATAGRAWRGQTDLDLDIRKETIFLLCLTSFPSWVHLPAPTCRHTLPASTPVAFSSCTQSSFECHRTVHWERTMVTIKPTSIRFGIVRCPKHLLLTGGNWWEIEHNNIGKGDISYVAQAWGSCAPFHYLCKGQGIQNVLCAGSVCAFDLNFNEGTNKQSNRKQSCPSPQVLKESLLKELLVFTLEISLNSCV